MRYVKIQPGFVFLNYELKKNKKQIKTVTRHENVMNLHVKLTRLSYVQTDNDNVHLLRTQQGGSCVLTC